MYKYNFYVTRFVLGMYVLLSVNQYLSVNGVLDLARYINQKSLTTNNSFSSNNNVNVSSVLLLINISRIFYSLSTKYHLPSLFEQVRSPLRDIFQRPKGYNNASSAKVRWINYVILFISVAILFFTLFFILLTIGWLGHRTWSVSHVYWVSWYWFVSLECDEFYVIVKFFSDVMSVMWHIFVFVSFLPLFIDFVLAMSMSVQY